MPSGAPLSAPLPAPSGSGGRYERVLRLSRLHYQPRLAVALERALRAEGALPGPPRRHGPAAPLGPDLVRGFVGALARLPDGRVRELVAFLEVFTFSRVLTSLLTSRPKAARPLQPLVDEWQARARQLASQDGLELRAKLVCAMRRRLVAVGASSEPPADVESFLRALLRRLAEEYRIAAGRLDEGLLQQVLLAAARSVPGQELPSGLGGIVGRFLARLAAQSMAAGTVMGLAYAGRQRISLTVTTLLYVLLTGLFGVQLPFGAYEWVARGIALLLEPPVLAASCVALGARALNTYQRRFEAAVLAHTLCAIYQTA